jgi:hypothetical protein
VQLARVCIDYLAQEIGKSEQKYPPCSGFEAGKKKE